jgi:hypothetical protein
MNMACVRRLVHHILFTFIVNEDYIDEILNKSLIDNLMINPKETPLIFTEAAIHNKDFRLKLT